MNKSIILSFNSLLFLAFALCISVAVAPAPASAETCMTESLMMVYEPVETVKPRVKKSKHKVALASHNAAVQKRAKATASVQALKPTANQVVAEKQLAVKHDDVKQDAVKQVAIKQPQSKT